MDLNPVTLIIILNINSLHLEIKKQKFSEWVKIKKKMKRPNNMLKRKLLHIYRDTQSKRNRMPKNILCKHRVLKAEVSILISDNADFSMYMNLITEL